MELRTTMVRSGALAALTLVVGAVCALLWVAVVTLPTFEVRADGRATITERELASVVGADAAFVVLGLVAGLVLGFVAWLWLRDVGWPVAFLAAGAGLVAGLVCWWLGAIVGPGSFAERMAEANAGDVVPMALQLHSPSALAAWSFTAVAVPLFAASLGPEGRVIPRPSGRRRSRKAVDDELAA